MRSRAAAARTPALHALGWRGLPGTRGRRQREAEFGAAPAARCRSRARRRAARSPCGTGSGPGPCLRHGGEEGREQPRRHLGGDAGAAVDDAEGDPARVRLAHAQRQHALGQRRVGLPSPGCRCATGSAAPARASCGRTARAAASGRSTSMRVPLLRACRRTSGSTPRSAGRCRSPRAAARAGARSLCTLLMTRPARSACSAMRSSAWRSIGTAPCAGVGLVQQVQRAGGVAGDGGQRLVQLVAQQRGHLAHRGQPRAGLQPLLLLARQLLDAALRADVEHGAHPAGVAALRSTSGAS
jgi:hypothetical protein